MENQTALKLLQAGKAIMTFKSKATDRHFTYKVTKAADKDNLFFCSVLNGPDNYSNYQYFGVLEGLAFRQTAKSRIGSDAACVKAFTYTLRHLLLNNLSEVEIYHEGKCCRCGRKLTTPESIERGIGPECIKHFN